MNNGGFSRVQTSHTGRKRSQVTQERPFLAQAANPVLFTRSDLHRCLYRRNQVILLSKDDLRTSFQHRQEVDNYWCRGCHQEKPEICQIHGPHQVFKITTTVNDNNETNNSNSQWPYALESFPNEVGLCKSGIPLAGYGVCAKQLIPVGTWIGPFEGEKVRPDQVSLGTDATYMWEIYHKGKLLCYIDGRDENRSSWMRYIRCARHGNEQNMFAFQYYGNIYYRAFRDIPPGEELLVWYDEKYPQYMGIPLEIQETSPGFPIDSRQHPEMMVAVPQENPQVPTRGYLSSGRPLIDNQHSPSLPSTSVRPSLPSHHPSRDRSFDQSHGSSRDKRRTSQNVSARRGSSRASLTAESHDTVGHYDTDTRFNEPMTMSFSPDDVSLERENQAVSFRAKSNVAKHTRTNGRHETMASTSNHGDESNAVPSVAEESQSISADDENNSSDGSDASFFNCGQCGKSFAQRSVLQIHVCPNRPHKPYHCGHCTQSFDHPTDLRMHAVIHAGEKPFKCGYCSRSFSGATTLHNHVRTHTGEKPFLCERCGKTFTQASQLHRHEAITGDCTP